jgi:DNA-binding Lrp family transcriptional regulator
LSPTATAERLKQMEEVGIVHGHTVEIDREALGLDVLAFIRMSCGGQQYHRPPRLCADTRGSPRVSPPHRRRRFAFESDHDEHG